MEIVYIYIHDYRRFKKQNINFGSKYVFHYDDKSNVLNVDMNHLYINKFYNQNKVNNIENISAIIGENGTGKTGLIDYLTKIYADGSVFSKDEPFMFVLKKEDTFTLYYSSDFYSNLVLKGNSKFIKNKYYKHNTDELDEKYNLNFGYPQLNLSNIEFNTTILKVSNIILSKGINGFSNIFDFSNDGMIQDYQVGSYFKEKKITNIYNSLKTENNENYIQLFNSLNKANYQSLIPFKIPHLVILKNIDNYLSINNSELATKYERIKSLISQSNKSLETIENKITENPDDKFNFILNIVLYVPIDLFNATIDKLSITNSTLFQDLIEKYFEKIEAYLNSTIRDSPQILIKSSDEKIKSIIDIFDKLVDGLVEIFGKNENQLGFTMLNTLEFIRNILLIKNTKPSYSAQNKSLTFELYFEFDDFINSDLLNSYSLSSSFRPFVIFEFDVPLSSGQYAFLNIFSRINSLFKNYGIGTNTDRNIEEHILLIIDEIELYLHPNWQKNIVSTLSSFLNQIYPNYKFQIIFTANNPLPISDLLSYNTIFLSNDECDNNTIVKDSLEDQKNTFAANIHTLLADSFFVKGGLIGDFSKNKINEVIQQISKGKDLSYEEHSYIKKFIKQIGEPLIKNKLLQMYSQNNSLDYLERLERVEKKLGFND